MTLGEKIKYIRKQLNITQDDLHQQTGINLTTIKKYETNRVQPLPPQVERIASAFDVSYVALNGVENVGFRLETVGDLMGILMTLINSNILCLTGERDQNNQLIEDSLFIFFNPTLNQYLNVGTPDFTPENTTYKKPALFIKDKNILLDLLKWERLHYMCIHAQRIAEVLSPELNALITEKEILEMDLQKNQTPLGK